MSMNVSVKWCVCKFQNNEIKSSWKWLFKETTNLIMSMKINDITVFEKHWTITVSLN